MDKYTRLLASIDLFKCFNEEDFQSIFKNNSSLKKYPKNSIIYMQNEECKSMDVILKGTITIQKIDSEGNILSLNDFSNGEIIGENLLFSVDNRYPMTISAISDVIILHIDKELVLKLCQINECFLLKFLQSLSSKALFLSNKITTLTMKSLRQCIIEFLLYEHHVQQTNNIKLIMTKKDLAGKFGVQRTSLSRELNKMRKDGLIDFDNNYIRIKDIKLLSELHVED